MEGTNPYDYDAIVALMAKVVPDREAIEPAWNPPWLAVVLIPLAAALPYDAAVRMWVVFNLLAVSGVAWVVWRWASNSRRLPPVWLPLVGLGFYAALVLIAIGQMTMIILLGVIILSGPIASGSRCWGRGGPGVDAG